MTGNGKTKGKRLTVEAATTPAQTTRRKPAPVTVVAASRRLRAAAMEAAGGQDHLVRYEQTEAGGVCAVAWDTRLSVPWTPRTGSLYV